MQSCINTSIVDLDINFFYGLDKTIKILYFFLKKIITKNVLVDFLYKNMFYNKR